MNDQKSINSTLGITCTRRCPACGLMNDKHMTVNQEFPGCEEKIDLFVCQMCLSILHYGLRLIEHLLGKIMPSNDMTSLLSKLAAFNVRIYNIHQI